MKIWKSPVFYLGILLVMLVSALLAAPYVVDWNGYRAELEAQGRKLTGRAVTIKGEISARLFPWPRLVIDDVSIANPPGLSEADFAHAGRIVTSIPLAGLLQGNIEVESIDIERPVINIERQASGQGNWSFAAGPGLRTSDVFKRIKLDRITLRDGVIRLTDRRRGEIHQFDDFNAAIAAPQFAGPWNVRSVALYRGRSVEIGLNTGIWREGEPLRFSLRLASADGSGFSFAFDGAQSGDKAEGEFRIEPAVAASGKEDAEGQMRPLVFKARTTATFDEVVMHEIEVAPRDITKRGTLITGQARFKLGKHITAEAKLTATTLDLDDLAGAGAREILREEGVLQLAGSLLTAMPAGLSLSGAFNVAALTMGTDTLDNAALSFDADSNAIRIRELTATLPGRTRILYEGIFFPGKVGAEAAGSLAVETLDLRRLSTWLWPESKERLETLWTGNRGQFRMQTGVSVTGQRLRFSKSEFELDGERGSAEFARTSGGRDAVDLRVRMGRVDIDSYLRGGFQTFSSAVAESAGSALARLLPAAGSADVLLNLKAGEAVLNGVTARDVSLDLASGVTGLDLRELKIGNVGGASLHATGLILGTAKGPDGSIGLEANAADPRGMLRLLGLVSGDADPPWVAELGATTLKATMSAKPRDGSSTAVFDLRTTSGGVQLTATGQIGEANGKRAINGLGELTTTSSGQLARILGLSPYGEDQLPGRAVATLSGRDAGGFEAGLQFEAYGAQGAYRGALDPFAAGLGLDGKASLKSTGTAPLLAALGLPLASLPDGVLVLDTPVTASGGAIKMPAIEGRFGEAKVSGDVSVGPGPVIAANLNTGILTVRDVLALAFLEPGRGEPGLDSAFASSLPFGLTGEIWLTPEALVVHDQFTARGVQIGITADPGEIAVAMFGKSDTGEDTHIEVASRGAAEVRKLAGKIIIPVDLATQLQLAGGTPVAAGKGGIEIGFSAEGRSPGGALAGFKANGAYRFNDLRLLGLSPEALLAGIATATDGAGITAAFDAMRGGELAASPGVKGFVTVVNGEVAFQPISFATAQSRAELRVMAELALGEIDADLSVSFPVRADLPSMSISYAGPPMALARGEDKSELSTKLGVAIMQQGIDELERLRLEQERLAAEEERQRIEDEIRLAAYYAQRDELILRRRELKVHSEMRLLEDERRRRKLEEERALNTEISKLELKQRSREIRILRQVARLERAARKKAEQQPRPEVLKPETPKPPARKTIEPVILEKPKTAPVIISPDPSPSPSQ